jgi:hypothetical protein
MSPEQEEALGTLMARAQRADAVADYLLLERWQVVVRRFVRRRVGDVPWLEDVVQGRSSLCIAAGMPGIPRGRSSRGCMRWRTAVLSMWFGGNAAWPGGR